MKNLARGLFCFALSFLSTAAYAAPAGLTLQGRLVKDDTPVSGAVTLTVAVRSPNTDSCLLFQETHTLTIPASEGGVFSVQIGAGTRTVSDKGFSLINVFSNTGTAINGLVCPGTGATAYTPASSDSRYVFVSFDSTVGSVAFTEPYVIQSVPYALEAEKLAGKKSSDFLQTVSSLEATPGTSQTRMARILDTDYTALDALLAGTSNQYMVSSSTAGTNIPVLSSPPGTLSAGKMWYEGGDLKYYDAVSATTKTLGASAGGSTVTASTSVVTPLVNGSATASGNITIDSTSNVAKGNIFLAPNGGNVGIGTTSPGSPLHVVQSTAASNIAFFRNEGNSTDLTIGTSGGAILMGSGAGDDLQLYSHGVNTQGIRINTSGQVGIGTTSPSYLLDVAGDARFGQTIVRSLTRTLPIVVNDAVDIGSFSLTNGSGVLNLTIVVGSSGYSVSKSYTLPTAYHASAGAWVTALPISSTGAFSPGGDFDLDVNSNNLITSLRLRRRTGTSAASANIQIQQSGFAANAFTPSTATASVTAPTAFYKAAVLTQVNGNVGIGTTTPATKLEVAGSVMLGNGAETCGGTYAGAIRYNTGNLSVEYCNGTGWLVMGSGSASGTTNASTISNTAGSITLSPLATTSVYVTSTVASTSTSTGALVVSGGVGVTGNVNASGNLVATGSVQGASAYIPQLYGASAASTDIKIDGTSGSPKGNVLLASAGGNVGIGTTTPSGTLDIKSSSGPSSLQFLTNGNITVPTTYAVAPSTAHAGQLFSYSENCGSSCGTGGTYQRYFDLVSNSGDASSSNMRFFTKPISGVAAERMRIDYAGNVGIGTTAPTSLLDVGSTYSAAGTMKIFDSSPSLILQRGTASAGSDWQILSDSSNNGLSFSPGYDGITSGAFRSPVMTILQGGNVGIGTTAPVTPFHVHNSAAAATSLHISNSSAGALVTDGLDVGIDAAGGASIWLRENQAMNFATNGTERMRIDGPGNVGIGTTAPVSLLDLSGTTSRLSLRHPSLAHGMTTIAPSTDTGGTLRTYNDGSLVVSGFAGSATSSGVAIVGYLNAPNAGTAAVQMNSFLKSGTSATAIGATDTAFKFTNFLADLFSILGNGNVGIGTTAPTQKLEVAGNVNVGSQTTRATASTNRGQLAMASSFTQTTNVNATLDWNNGNIQEISTFACNGTKSITMSNIRDGASYTLLLSGTAAHSGACVFAGSGFTFVTTGGAVAPTTSKDALFTFVVVGTTVIYNMSDNLQ